MDIAIIITLYRRLRKNIIKTFVQSSFSQPCLKQMSDTFLTKSWNLELTATKSVSQFTYNRNNIYVEREMHIHGFLTYFAQFLSFQNVIF